MRQTADCELFEVGDRVLLSLTTWRLTQRLGLRKWRESEAQRREPKMHEVRCRRKSGLGFLTSEESF